MTILLVMLICAAVVLAGRAHSRYLDRLEEENTWLILNDQRLKIVRTGGEKTDSR
jgi:hypothetical protein